MLSRGRCSLRVSMARGYATRRAERPPPKFRDPLVNNPHAVVEKVSDRVTFIHRPPPTAPTPLSTTLLPASPLLRPPSISPEVKIVPSTSAPSSSDEITVEVPPPIRKPRSFPNNHICTEEDFEEMRRLRASDPVKYTRSYLAKTFSCPSFLVGQKVPLETDAHREAVRKMEEEHQRERAKWGERKALVTAIRKKRRTYW